MVVQKDGHRSRDYDCYLLLLIRSLLGQSDLVNRCQIPAKLVIL